MIESDVEAGNTLFANVEDLVLVCTLCCCSVI